MALAMKLLGDDRILPVLIDDCDADEFHIRIPRLQHVDLRSPSPGQVEALKRSAASLLGRPLLAPVPPTLKRNRIAIWPFGLLAGTVLVVCLLAYFGNWGSIKADGPKPETPPTHPEKPAAHIAYPIDFRWSSPDRMHVEFMTTERAIAENAKPATGPDGKPIGPNVRIIRPIDALKLPLSTSSEQYGKTDWGFDGNGLLVPFHNSLDSGSRYRARFSGLPRWPGHVFYPHIEIRPLTPEQHASIRNNPITVDWSDFDFESVREGKEVAKVWYLEPNGQLTQKSTNEHTTVSEKFLKFLANDQPLIIFRLARGDLENPYNPKTPNP